MALRPTEAKVNGFVRDGDQLSLTNLTAGATWQQGFLRDPDGRLVVRHG